MLERKIPDERYFVLLRMQDISYGGRNCCSQAVYTVDDEGLEEDGTVGRGASQLVNHSYSRGDTSGEATQGRRGTRKDGGWTTQTDMVRGRR